MSPIVNIPKEMVAFTAQAVNTVANFILEKMALNDEETLADIEQEILNCIIQQKQHTN